MVLKIAESLFLSYSFRFSFYRKEYYEKEILYVCICFYVRAFQIRSTHILMISEILPLEVSYLKMEDIVLISQTHVFSLTCGI